MQWPSFVKYVNGELHSHVPPLLTVNNSSHLRQVFPYVSVQCAVVGMATHDDRVLFQYVPLGHAEVSPGGPGAGDDELSDPEVEEDGHVRR